MAYEVLVTSANKTVATIDAVNTLVGKIQNTFGADTRIDVYEVKKTYDNNRADANEVGMIRSLVATYPAVK